jgi:sugar phosphate isomerase/epimerase
MKLGVFNPIFNDLALEPLLETLNQLGLEAVELRSGLVDKHEIAAKRYPGQHQCDPKVLNADKKKLLEFQKLFRAHNIEISALSCHGNPVHPDPKQARVFHESFQASVLLAEKLGVKNVVTFSGAPGGNAKDKTPNWITYTWPPEYGEALEYQWQQVLIPYWREAAKFAKKHGVRIAIEPHPGFCVYNLSSFLKLRESMGDTLGETIGMNFDPSHLFWQNVDAVRFIRAIPGMIYHVHAKDTYLDPVNMPLKGVLDTSSKLEDRPFYFRSVGYGMGEKVWRDIISALRTSGYDDVISIEHEDALASQLEGVKKAIGVLKSVILSEPTGGEPWRV